MDLAQEKQKLIEELNAIDDIHLINAIKEMLNYAHHFSDTELISRIRKSEDDMTAGRTISLAQVREKYYE